MDEEYTPVVGDGATYHIGSDSFPATIVEIRPNGRVVIQEDKATLVKGDCAGGEQQWQYEADTEGETYICYKNKRGRWTTWGSGRPVSLGHRRRYHDPSF